MKTTMLSLALTFAIGSGAFAQSADKIAKTKAQFNADLMIAISNHQVLDAKTALQNGADPNGRNWLGITPLMWASVRGEDAVVEQLLKSKAELEGSSLYGSAFTFAILGRHEDLALALLNRGAKPDAFRLDKTTSLMLAVANGETRLASRLLSLHCNPNAKDADGATPLIYAARLGRIQTLKLLLKAGAKTNIADSHGETALMYAAKIGDSEILNELLSHHPKIDRVDHQGRSALSLAARYSGNPGVIHNLLQAGAKADLKDGTGQTPLKIASQKGFQEAAKLLRNTGENSAQLEMKAVLNSPEQAVKKALIPLQASMREFDKRANCVSCHHQGLGLMTLGIASKNGFKVDAELVGSYLNKLGEGGKASGELIHAALTDRTLARSVPTTDILDFSIGNGYILGAMIANGIPTNPGFEDSAQFLATQQSPDGSWRFGILREPMQSSYITTTALVIKVLKTYGNPSAVAESISRAKGWLLKVQVQNSEERASRLLGLRWSGAKETELDVARKELSAKQRPDGGWTQNSEGASDAYATGLALYALRVGGGIASDDKQLQKGVGYLLRTQDSEGSWYVNKTANPANNYFDAAFPHGEAQYSSFIGTCWATLALIETKDPQKSASR